MKGRNRSRPGPLTPVSFTLDGYGFEIIDRDLWATPPGSERYDRVKVTRSSVSRSANSGYPRMLVWPRDVEDRPLEELRRIAGHWISWRGTAGWARHPEVGIEAWLRRAESGAAAAA